MATVTKDFRIKSGLVVEGANGTINGSDILTEDAISGGTQNNITVTYNAVSKTVDFHVDALAIDVAGPLTYTGNILDVATGDGLEIVANALAVDASYGLSFVDGGLTVDANAVAGTGLKSSNAPLLHVLELDSEHVTDLIANTITGGTQSGISVTYDDNANAISFDVNDPTITIDGDVDGSATMTNLGNTTITVTLDTVNANVGTFGSSTAIPVVTVNAKGLVTAVGESTISTTLNVAGDTGNTAVALGTDTLTFSGGEGIDVSVANNDTVTISAETATDTNKGVAAFSSNNFSINIYGVVSSNQFTIGSTSLNLGGNVSAIAGLTQLDVDDITINGNEISVSSAINPDLFLNPNTGGHVNVSNSKIVNLATPENASDAATKAYVDGVAEGLHVHASVVVATTSNIDFALFNTGNGPTTIDNVALLGGERVLVKSQTNAEENGIYVASGDAATAWDRAEDYNTAAEVDAGDFVFVQQGDTYGATGWVQTQNITTLGTDDIIWEQFSGAGTYVNGTGLTLDGNEFAIDDNVVVTHTDLDGYLNSTVGEEGTTILYVQDYVDNAIAVGDGTATPTYLALDVNSIAKQVAAEVNSASANTAVTAYSFDKTEYRAAKFLVKVSYGSHSEVSEVLLTLDSSDNIAITEYAVVSTNGSASTITADVNTGNVRLRVTPTNESSNIKVFGTLLI